MNIIIPIIVLCTSIQDLSLNSTNKKNKGTIIKGCKVGIMQVSERKRKKILENCPNAQLISSSTLILPAKLKND